MSRIIGIDLGTTNSCVAVLDGGDATVVIAQRRTARGRCPSMVVVAADGRRRWIGAGLEAPPDDHQPRAAPMFAVKRLMGRQDRRPRARAPARGPCPYQVVAAKPTATPTSSIDGRVYAIAARDLGPRSLGQDAAGPPRTT
jgi:molecular chaperone DnaK